MKGVILLVLICLMGLVQGAEASTGFDFGDFLALVLGLGIGITGLLACLGAYSRKLTADPF